MAVRTAMDDALEQAVVAGDMPGVVAMAADANGVVYQGAYGKRTAGGDADMTTDTVFWLASMTKAVTSVAAMQQVERGKLSLDEPIATVLPELADPQVLEGFDDAGAPRLRPARSQISLRQLLTHTAGYSYNIWNADVARYMEHASVPGIITCEKAAIRLPLVCDPGERWEYGINIDWAGQAVERASGLSLNDYLRQEIFEPLGMADTEFVLRPEHRTRLAGMHVRGEDGSLSPIEFELPQAPEFFMGGGGLYSVGRDYLTFLQMLLHGGTFNGAQILQSETVAEIGRNQIGEIPVTRMITVDPGSSRDAELFPGMPKRWGLGYMISLEPTPAGRSAGSGAWAGLANTFFWLDPTRRVTGLILTQILPFGDPAVLGTFERFERAVYDSLVA